MRSTRSFGALFRGSGVACLAALGAALAFGGCGAEPPLPGDDPDVATSGADLAPGIFADVTPSVRGATSAGCINMAGVPVCGGSVLWAERFGGPMDQIASTAAFDMAGNILVGGAFAGSIDFGNGATWAHGSDGWAVKLDGNGRRIWSKHLGAGGQVDIRQIAADPAGNVLIAGHFSGAMDIGDRIVHAAGEHDLFVVMVDANGKPRWGHVYGDAADQQMMRLAVDGDGNTVLMGWMAGRVDFGAGWQRSHLASWDLFVTKLDPAGRPIWAKRFGDGSDVHGYGLAVDRRGMITVTGHFDGHVDFGLGRLESTGADDAFILRLDPAGQPLWNKHLGGAGTQHAGGVAADYAGNVVVAGIFAGSVDFGGGALVSAGSNDLFVAKLDPDGKQVWAKRFGDAGPNGYLNVNVAVDDQGAPAVAGIFDGVIDLGGGRLRGEGMWSFFVARFDRHGRPLWSHAFGQGRTLVTTGLAVSHRGDVLVAGEFQRAFSFSPVAAPLVSEGGYDAFVLRLTP
jgi:hypothetical protein